MPLVFIKKAGSSLLDVSAGRRGVRMRISPASARSCTAPERQPSTPRNGTTCHFPPQRLPIRAGF